jgi:hypothetical protein
MSIAEAAAKKALARQVAAVTKYKAARLKAEEAVAQGRDVCSFHCVVCGDMFVREREHGTGNATILIVGAATSAPTRADTFGGP